MSSFNWPSTIASGGVATYPTLASFPSAAGAGNGALAIDLSTDNLYISNGTSWVLLASPGAALTLGPFGSTPNANGLSLASGVLNMQPADGTHPGGVSILAQSFAGQKTFTTGLTGTLTGAASLNVLTSALGTLTETTSSVLTLASWANATVGSPTITVKQAGTSQAGYLSSADWNTFNGKQATGNYATSGSGDVSWSAPSGAGPVTTALVATTNATLVTASALAAIGAQSQALNMNSHLINNVTTPVSAQDAATKSYVDASVAALNPADAVYAATAGSNIAGTYVAVGAGIGDTFTTTSTSTFTVDGTTPALGARILIKDQSSGYQNGIYTITQTATGVLPTIFTRALDYDTPSDMNSAGLIPVINGTVNALSSWQQTATVVSIGPAGTALVFQEFTANPSLYLLKANNLSDVASAATAINNILPSQTGNSGKALTTNGTAASWATLQSLLGSIGVVLFSSSTSGTFTTPANSSTSTLYRYRLIAGGGGGGGANAAQAAGAGGGAGALAEGTFSGVAAGATVTITVGAGGTAGASSGATGGTGGTSQISATGMATVTVLGGVGGGGSSGTSGAFGGTGGTVSAGSPNITSLAGPTGQHSTALPASGFGLGGLGAGSTFGSGGVGGAGGLVGPGGNGIAYGSGGGGGIGSGSIGGVGAPGYCAVEQLTP